MTYAPQCRVQYEPVTVGQLLHIGAALHTVRDKGCATFGAKCTACAPMLAMVYIGVVTMPFGCREGINIFLAGFIPTENLRFRDFSLSFKVSENAEEGESIKQSTQYDYPDMIKTMQACTARVCLCDHAVPCRSKPQCRDWSNSISACRMPKTKQSNV